MRKALLALCLVVACQRPASVVPIPIEADGLHNVFRVSERLYSGSGPEGDAGFASLAKLGVKTVISVDGATPDVAAAKRHGLNYVHAPVGYDGIPRDKLLVMAKAVRELPGPVYVHCHHGKHRGPAAVAAIQLCLDATWTPARADAWMTRAGTDPKYTGLYGVSKEFVAPTAEEFAGVKELPTTVAVPDLTRRMVEIDAVWDHIKLVNAAEWKAPPNHPDIDPPHGAVQLVEHYREAGRLSSVQSTKGLAALFTEAEAAAGQLESALRAQDAPAAAKAFAASATLCQTCHTRFRDRR